MKTLKAIALCASLVAPAALPLTHLYPMNTRVAAVDTDKETLTLIDSRGMSWTVEDPVSCWEFGVGDYVNTIMYDNLTVLDPWDDCVVKIYASRVDTLVDLELD